MGNSIRLKWETYFACKINVFIIDPCKNSPCENGGTCENVLVKHECQCIEPWTGDDCSKKGKKQGGAVLKMAPAR